MKPTSMRAALRWDELQFLGTKFWLPGSVLLFAALAAYCELCTLLAGLPRAGIGVSALWALQITVGWAIVGAFLATYGARLAQAPVVRARPIVSGAVAVLAISTFALTSEIIIASLRGETPEVLSLLGVRGPMTLAGSTLAVVTFGLRRFLPKRAAELKVMTGTGHVAIATADIESLEADGNYLNVAHISGRTYLLRSTMCAAERQLGPDFVRIHRSTIVNRNRIREQRRGGQLVLQSGRTVRIGRAFRNRLT
jgi:DNA-binding LytR/AlgR family response regulator